MAGIMHLLIEILRNSILITGLVVVMMMMIESLNIESRGLFFKGLRKTRTGQVVIAALLGSVPGCMGGFATVSLYTHRMFSFGALTAMMIASSGDEAFIMLAMIPQQSLIIFAVLFVLAVITGIVVDMIWDRKHSMVCAKHDHSGCGPETDFVIVIKSSIGQDGRAERQETQFRLAPYRYVHRISHIHSGSGYRKARP